MTIALNDAITTGDVDLSHGVRPNSLLAHMNPVSASHPSWLYSGADLEVVCGGVGTTTAFCLPRDAGIEDKTPFTGTWTSLSPLAVYALHECSAIGSPQDERASKAQQALSIGEQTAIEQQFADLVTENTDTVAGTAASLLEALATAEATLGYDLERLIHLNAGDVVRLSAQGALRIDGNGVLQTFNGTRVVSGVGYPTDLGVLVTGPVLGIEGETVVTETTLEVRTNLMSVLAEKPWALGYACGAHRITVTP